MSGQDCWAVAGQGFCQGCQARVLCAQVYGKQCFFVIAYFAAITSICGSQLEFQVLLRAQRKAKTKVEKRKQKQKQQLKLKLKIKQKVKCEFFFS